MNFFGFGNGPEIEILLDGQDKRKTAEIKNEEGKRDRHLLYYDGETVSGEVKVSLKRGAKLDHQCIRIELIGQIELYFDRGNHSQFICLTKDLARPGEITQNRTFKFEFLNAAKPYESYTGINCKLRYFLRFIINKRLTDIIKEREIIVHSLSQYPDVNTSIKMEVGIEDCLHIEFEYNRSKFHLNDVIVGKIYFLLVRIKVKNMELAILRRETTGAGPNTFNENETICKFEIMDGAPVRGESIPIRVFLAGNDLTPTFRDVGGKFSVRYFINLVLVDDDERRYFKQQEIILWRKVDRPRKTFQASLQQQHREMQNVSAQVVSPNVSMAPTPGSSKSCLFNGNGNPSVESVAEAVESQKEDVKALPDNPDAIDSASACSAPLETKVGSPSSSTNGTIDKFSQEFEKAVSLVSANALSDDGSSDDEVPTLTGSVCQADVHNVSYEEPKLEAAGVGTEIGDGLDQGYSEKKNSSERCEGKEE